MADAISVWNSIDSVKNQGHWARQKGEKAEQKKELKRRKNASRESLKAMVQHVRVVSELNYARAE